MTALAIPADLQPVEPAYRNALRARAAAFWTPLLIASLVVHTAGTHNSIVTLPGLSPERAAEIREAIRSEIRADAE